MCICVHVYVCIFTRCMCMCNCGCSYTCMHMYTQPKIKLRYYFPGMSSCPLKQGLSLALNLLFRLSWPISFCFPSDGITHLFMGSETKILTSAQLALYQMIFPLNSVVHYYNSRNTFVVINTILFPCLTEIRVLRLKLLRSSNYMIDFKYILNCPTT